MNKRMGEGTNGLFVASIDNGQHQYDLNGNKLLFIPCFDMVELVRLKKQGWERENK